MVIFCEEEVVERIGLVSRMWKSVSDFWLVDDASIGFFPFFFFFLLDNYKNVSSYVMK